MRVLWESQEAKAARDYLLGRGLEEGTLREYRVGYSPSRWDRVLVASRSAGFTEEELLTTGLAQRSREGRGVFDRFRSRVMFPLTDIKGRVRGFGARGMSADARPKYLNTSDGEVFHKGDIVYGADLARPAAARAGRIVLVEGYTDVIALRQAGVPEAVCSMGTALAGGQVDVLAKLAPRVLFCQDSDAAGQNAVDKSLDLVTKRSGGRLELRIVRLPKGQDPADVVQRSGADEMLRLLGDAVPVAHFQIERALEGDLQTTEGRDEILTIAAGVLAPLGPSVLREELVKLVSGRLNVSVSLVESAIADPVRRRAAERAAAEAAQRAASRSPDGPAPQEVRTARPASHEPGPHDFAAHVHDDPGPEEGTWARNGAERPLDRREQIERAFLSYCLALPEEGERRLAEADLDELFAAPMTRRAAEYLKGRVRTPAADLPPDDEPLARLVAELVIRSGQLEATPAKLELEALQLDLSRLDRLIATARVSGSEGMRDLAVKRQSVLDDIRHRLT